MLLFNNVIWIGENIWFSYIQFVCCIWIAALDGWWGIVSGCVHFFVYYKGGGKCVCPRLSVCLLARLRKDACKDLHEMLRVIRCRDVDELINFWARSGLVRIPEQDCFLCYHISHATRNFTSVKSDIYVLVAAARCGFKMVLPPTAAATRGRRNTFVGGTCAAPSALLVSSRLRLFSL